MNFPAVVAKSNGANSVRIARTRDGGAIPSGSKAREAWMANVGSRWGVLVEPMAIGVGFGAVVAVGWLVVLGGRGLPVLALACGALGGVGLCVGLLRWRR